MGQPRTPCARRAALFPRRPARHCAGHFHPGGFCAAAATWVTDKYFGIIFYFLGMNTAAGDHFYFLGMNTAAGDTEM